MPVAHIAAQGPVTGLRAPGISFDDPDCVRKTFPGFHRAFVEFAAKLRGGLGDGG